MLTYSFLLHSFGGVFVDIKGITEAGVVVKILVTTGVVVTIGFDVVKHADESQV